VYDDDNDQHVHFYADDVHRALIRIRQTNMRAA
jgi:hypothetical protein